MGLKRSIKREVKKCFSCGYKFQNEKEKHIERIDYETELKVSNIVVLCETCKRNTQKGLIKVYNKILFDDEIKEYFKYLGRKIMYMVKKKILRTKTKYLNKKLDTN